MEKEDEFLYSYFTSVSQMCFDKAKESVEKEKQPKMPATPWSAFLNLLQQLALAEKSYMEIGFLHNKPKGFLRRDNSLKFVYETMKNDVKKIEDSCKYNVSLKRLQNYCKNIFQFLCARISLMEFYEKLYNSSASGKQIYYSDLLKTVETLIENNILQFTDISMTPMKAVYGLECEILQQIFQALNELQRLRFVPSLVNIHGVHARLGALESKIQRETWKIGIFKNSPLPALIQWLQKFKGAVLSKFSLYFHDTLANQTTPNEMKHLCSKLHHDHYHRMMTFQKKYDAAYIILLSNSQEATCDTTDYDSFPIIVSYPPRSPPQLDTILKMISDSVEILNHSKSITKYSPQDACTYCLTMVESNIYMVILFENKKTEKDSFISSFVTEFCENLRSIPQSTSVKVPKIEDIKVSPVSIPVDVVTPPNVSAFDEIPGPVSLRLISKFWSYVPVVSAEFTGGALFQVLNLGKFFGNLLSWGGNEKFFQKFFNVYGPVVRLHGPFGGDVVLLSRPEHASIVFQCEGNLPTRSCLDSIEKYRMEYRKMRQAGPFLMSGTEWEKLHKTLEKPMQMCVGHHFKTIQEISDEFVNRTATIRNRQEEVPSDFQNEILKWCLESMCSITLNRRFGFLDPCGLSSSSDPGRLLEGINGATEAIRKCEYGFHVWKFVETPSWKALVKHCDSVDSILSKYVEHAQSSLKSDQNSQAKLNASNISVLESLLSKDDVLIEDVMTVLLDMLLIGSNALAHSVAFLFYNLAKNPRCQKKVLEEIQKQPVELSPENLKKMTYLRACIKESLRMKPPIPIINRVLQKNAIVHNYFLPKGTYVLIAAHLASMREEYFEDANKFKPERWFGQEDNSCLAKEVQYFASIPFGHGPKSCVAKELAEVQMALLAVKMLKKFKIEYNYGEIKSSNLMLASPTKPLRFRFADRV